MMPAEFWDLAKGVAGGLLATTLFILALFIGFCVVLNLPKLRRGGAGSKVVRNLEERLGLDAEAAYLPPDAPRGPVDQLRGV